MKLKLSILFLIAALLTAGYGAAALTSVSVDRTVAAGTVLADTAADVAVKFTAGTGYTAVMSEDTTTGEVSFNLNKLLKAGAAGTGFNTESQFGIGSATAPVFTITNNTDVAVTVALTSATGGLTLTQVGGTTSIASGATASFYFTINTSGVNKGTAIGGTLSVTKAA